MYMIRDEVTENANYYLQFLVDSSHHDLMYHMNQYVFHKMYNTDFGNLVPLILANFLHVNIGIISKDVHGYNARVIHANASNDKFGNILVYKTPDHYDGIILKPVASGFNSQSCDKYKRLGGSSTGTDRLNVPVNDSSRLCEKHRFSDGPVSPELPRTSGVNSMKRENTPSTMLLSDRATNLHEYGKSGIGNDESITDTKNSLVYDELPLNRSSNFVNESITIDRDMTQPLEIDETVTSEPKDFISDLKNLRYCNPKNMIIGHVNINSLRNKYDPIRSILQNGLCDIFTLSETKLDESFPTAQFHITNFTLHRKDRNAHGGGIITYIRSDLPHRRRTDLELNHGSAFELVVLEVQFYKKEKWLICSCYKPPCIKDSVFERSFSELLNYLQIESPHILIIGDINFDMNKEKVLYQTYAIRMIWKTLLVAQRVTKGQSQPLLMLFFRRNQNVSNTL